MRVITATELKKHLGYYLELSAKENVYVTKNNRVITVLSNPQDAALNDFLSLRGILKTPETEGFTSDELLGKAILEKYGLLWVLLINNSFLIQR